MACRCCSAAAFGIAATFAEHAVLEEWAFALHDYQDDATRVR